MTREHVWSAAVVDSFKDAPYTIDNRRGKIYKAAPVVKDICGKCNQALSPCDSYMAQFAQNNLRGPLLGKSLSFDLPNLTRWIIKTSANHSRAAGEDKLWWKKYRSFIRFGVAPPPDIDMFAAPWLDPRPPELQQLLPVPALGARSLSLDALSDRSWVGSFYAGWALKVGSAVFAFIDWIVDTPPDIRNRIRDNIREYGWSLLGLDKFPSGYPFNQYTCVFYNFISDPTKPLTLEGQDLSILSRKPLAP